MYATAGIHFERSLELKSLTTKFHPCNELGYFAKDCKQPTIENRTCIQCNVQGHIKSGLPEIRCAKSGKTVLRWQTANVSRLEHVSAATKPATLLPTVRKITTSGRTPISQPARETANGRKRIHQWIRSPVQKLLKDQSILTLIGRTMVLLAATSQVKVGATEDEQSSIGGLAIDADREDLEDLDANATWNATRGEEEVAGGMSWMGRFGR